MNIYCDGERTTMRIWGKRWTCDRCGKKLWRSDVAKKRVTPGPDEVKIAYVYPGSYGFRYTCRGYDNKVIYDSRYAFRSRHDARDEIKRLWPKARVSFETN